MAAVFLEASIALLVRHVHPYVGLAPRVNPKNERLCRRPFFASPYLKSREPAVCRFNGQNKIGSRTQLISDYLCMYLQG